jgi:phenylpyruvate tautomerase PptA (4-oxalocrotonate tautomerase family)
MPTYVCYLPPDLYDARQKARIADAISQRHSQATGAPPCLVQVQIEETRADRYLGGQLTQKHIWVRGDIRAGRSEHQRTSLILNIMRDISEITGASEDNIWIYLCNLLPTDAVEYGHVLPSLGEEQQWFANLPPKLREYLGSLGTTKENFTL